MASRFWVGGTGTWDASDTSHWSATTGGAAGASVPGSGDTATLDASSGGGTVTVNANFTISTLTMGAFTGTLDFATNNNSPTMTAAVISGTGTRTLNMGNGTWTITSTSSSNIWDATTTTNLTFNRNSSTLALTGATATGSKTFQGGGLYYNTVTISGMTTGWWFLMSGSGNRFATLNINAGCNIQWASNTTTTIDNAFTWAGDASHYWIMSAGSSNIEATIVATGGGTITHCAIHLCKFTTGTVNATDSFNCRQNSGITITPPATGGGGGARVIGG